MQCVKCNYPGSKVVDTTQDHERNMIYRRRECVKCGVRWSTQENLRNNYERKKSDYKTPPPQRILLK